jgi:hypothetical protein
MAKDIDSSILKQKVRVFVGHKQIGWLRELKVQTDSGVQSETVVTPSLAKATVYPAMEAGYAMALFQGPDREPGP